MVPRENKNNAYAKFGGTNKDYYGILRSGPFETVMQTRDAVSLTFDTCRTLKQVTATQCSWHHLSELDLTSSRRGRSRGSPRLCWRSISTRSCTCTLGSNPRSSPPQRDCMVVNVIHSYTCRINKLQIILSRLHHLSHCTFTKPLSSTSVDHEVIKI